MTTQWRSVTAKHRCTVCGRPNAEHQSTWCSYSVNGDVTQCMFTPSPYKTKRGGWLFFRNPSPDTKQVHRSMKPITPWVDWQRLTELYQTSLNGELKTLASSLGVSQASLAALEVGWDGEASTWPMRDATRAIVGIRRRWPDGRKKAFVGGSEGVFMPAVLPDGKIWIVEGATDTAALLTLGLTAIGRPSCSGGTKIIAALVALRDVVIVADNDSPGLRGATMLMRTLQPLCKSVVSITPPNGHKDVREAINKGCTRKDFE